MPKVGKKKFKYDEKGKAAAKKYAAKVNKKTGKAGNMKKRSR